MLSNIIGNLDIFLNPPTPDMDVQINISQKFLVSEDPPHPYFGQCLKICSFFYLMDPLTCVVIKT